jgi:hypothetical protein
MKHDEIVTNYVTSNKLSLSPTQKSGDRCGFLGTRKTLKQGARNVIGSITSNYTGRSSLWIQAEKGGRIRVLRHGNGIETGEDLRKHVQITTSYVTSNKMYKGSS